MTIPRTHGPAYRYRYPENPEKMSAHKRRRAVVERYEFAPEQKIFMEGMQIPFAVYQFIDKRVVTLVLSEGFCELFGYGDRQQAYHDMNTDMYKDTHPDDAARIADAAFRFATEGGNYETVYRNRDAASGAYRVIHARGKHVYTENGTRLAYIWYSDEGRYTEDMGQFSGTPGRSYNSILYEESLMRVNHYDYLTGMPSMSCFFELAEAGREAINRSGGKAVMLFADFSGMRYYNTKYGFAEGDKLILSFAKLLIRRFSNENCCHIGGDHFAVFTREDGIEEEIKALFLEVRELNGGVSLPLRVGIYQDRMEEVPASMACDRAKYACDALRNTFLSSYGYYSMELSEDAEKRQYVLTHLDQALAERWIEVYYQPIVRAMTGRVCDEEALARWIDPERGYMSPAEFIPYLEDAGLIYQLDLYVLDRVLEKLRVQQNANLFLVPQSINLSRSDFQACDMVEEIRRRVDASGFSRGLISIEITESVIGDNFDFMKEQVERFQELGFPVWIDDFGSGYSALDALQSIKFDLIKFDMSFMQKLNEEKNSKVVLTELMKLATALNMDTLCEGVETEEQAEFLQEIGCSKLQGFLFTKPIPLKEVLGRYERGEQIGFENPMASGYYDAIGRINLYDLMVIANGEDAASIRNYFDTLPMGILEVENGKARIVRSNQTFRQFMKRFFNLDLTSGQWLNEVPDGIGANFMKLIRQCCKTGQRAYFDDRLADGTMIHSFLRRIGMNPVNGRTAVAMAVLSVTEKGEGTDYASIARALASDYYNIYYVNLKDERFIEYTSRMGQEGLTMERHGEHFFENARRDVEFRIYEEDREPFLKVFTRENVLRSLDEKGVFAAFYRLIDNGAPMYAHLKITRLQQDPDHLILGVNLIDSQMKQKEMNDSLRRDQKEQEKE